MNAAIEETRAPGYHRNADDLPPGDKPAPTPSGETDSQELFSDEWLLARSRAIYTTSTDYLEANVRNQWQRAIAHSRNEHAGGTGYTQNGYKRSKVFRPKTRSMLKGHEAACASAVFSTPQVADVVPQDPMNEEAAITAEVTKALMEYRFRNSMPWFQTVIGAYQDTKVYGLCISHQRWDYQVVEDVVPEFDDAGHPLTEDDAESGEKRMLGRVNKRVIADRPCVDLREPENVRFDPMCDWRDPAGTSPYIVDLVPMYAGDVLLQMENPDPRKRWRKYDLAQILSARRETTDGTRQAREGNKRVDPAQQQVGDEMTTVWAHFNIYRFEGVDFAWWTLGTELLLTDAIPLAVLYPHLPAGVRPYVIGFSTIEAHRNYPDGDVTQAAPLQAEINDIANQRLDNVKLVLNKRYFIRRGSQIDIDALIRNVPGGGVMVNDPEKDVQVIDTRDVTGSSYQEQDRLSVEYDELTGGFSQGSVMSNRKLNETVGGLDRLAGVAGAVQDYGLTIFFQTWLEPVLKQVQKLIAAYETDEVILAMVAKKTNLWKRYGVDKVTDNMFRHDLVVQVNVAVGNTDPVKRVERLMVAVKETAALPGMVERLKSPAIADEVFGSLGFRGASRFVMSDEEMAAEAQEKGPPPPPPDIMLKQQELEIRKQDNVMRHQRELADLDLRREVEFAKLALEQQTTLDDLATKLGVEQMKNKTLRDTTALKEANKLSEMNLKQATGEGI